MKKLLPILLVAVIAITFAACSNKSQTNASTAPAITSADTAGLADFQKWKQLNELKNFAMYQQEQEVAYTQPVKKVVHKTSTASSKKVSMNSVDQYPAKTVQKKGWSSKAKAAAIGGGGGAILGAILDKNHRIAGGIIGGLLGAGAGYVVGNEIDRKHGRY